MDELIDRMSAAVAALELAAERLQEREAKICAAAEERVEQIVATVEGHREAELAERLRCAEDKLVQAEARIAELTAGAATLNHVAGRKTATAGAVFTLAKQGPAAGALDGLETGRIEAGSLDAALTSLSIEQRFAVKAEMLRSGLLG